MASSVPSLLFLSKAITIDDARPTVSTMEVDDACTLHDVNLYDAALPPLSMAPDAEHAAQLPRFVPQPPLEPSVTYNQWTDDQSTWHGWIDYSTSPATASALPPPWGSQRLRDSCPTLPRESQWQCILQVGCDSDTESGVVVLGRKRRGGALDERPSLGPRMEWFQCNICCRWCNQRCDCERNGAAPCYS